MYFGSTSPSQMSLPGAMAPSMAFDRAFMLADGTAPRSLLSATTAATAANASSNNSDNTSTVNTNTANTVAPPAAAPPSYEAIVLNPNGPRSQTNLFVRKLASAVKEKDMKVLFEQYGTIVSFALMRDIHTGESLGTAFVRYRTHEEARAAMAGLDGTELYGRPISIQWAKKEHDGTPCGDARRKIHKLFVRNIPLSVAARHLRQVFSHFGTISNVTLHSDTAPAVPRDDVDDIDAPQQEQQQQQQQMRNIAFILFQEDGAAERAVSALHNTCPFTSCEGIPLMVKLAEDNRDRLGRKPKGDATTVDGVAGAAAAVGAAMNAPFAPNLMSTPISATLGGQVFMPAKTGTPLMMSSTNSQSGLPIAPAPPAAAATAATAPMLQVTHDASGNTAYVYVTAPTAGANTGFYYVQTPNGLQAIPPSMMMPSLQSAPPPPPPPLSAPQAVSTYFSAAAAPPPSSISGTANASPFATATGPAFYPSMTMPSPIFFHVNGNPVQAAPPSSATPGFMPAGFYPSFASQPAPMMMTPPQLMVHQQQQQQQAAMAGSMNFAGAFTSSTPTSVPSLSSTPTARAQAKAQAKESAGTKVSPTQPGFETNSPQSVSPRLSSAGSNHANLHNTNVSSVVASPADGGVLLSAAGLAGLA